jgi:hypothetical protein
MTYFDSEIIQVMQNALEEVMTRVRRRRNLCWN